jgi:hypothetical protein
MDRDTLLKEKMATGIDPSFFLSFFIALIITYQVSRMYPDGNKMIIIIAVPVFLTYIIYSLFSVFFPRFIDMYEKVSEYGTSNASRSMDSTGFYHVYPPLLFVLILFIILLYQRRLG